MREAIMWVNDIVLNPQKRKQITEYKQKCYTNSQSRKVSGIKDGIFDMMAKETIHCAKLLLTAFQFNNFLILVWISSN